jgi:hypothetical protein
MLAFSAVTQFPTNGSSTRTAGEGVQASTSAEHVMTVERHKFRIASPQLGTIRTLSPDSRVDTRARAHAATSAAPRMLRRMRAVFASPRVLRRAHPLIW